MTREETNRLLLEFMGWREDPDPRGKHDPLWIEPVNGHFWQKNNLPDLFRDTEGAEWREKILLKLTKEYTFLTYAEGEKHLCQVGFFAKVFCESYAEAFCEAAASAVLELRKSEADNGKS